MKYLKNGFTLVELLIVIAIIAILAGISANGIMVQQKKARDARRRADLQLIRGAMEQYRIANVNHEYPIHSGDIGSLTALDNYLDRAMPNDPKSGQFYNLTSVAATYDLGALMEYDTASNCTVPLDCDGVSNPCTYCVAQP